MNMNRKNHSDTSDIEDETTSTTSTRLEPQPAPSSISLTLPITDNHLLKPATSVSSFASIDSFSSATSGNISFVDAIAPGPHDLQFTSNAAFDKGKTLNKFQTKSNSSMSSPMCNPTTNTISKVVPTISLGSKPLGRNKPRTPLQTEDDEFATSRISLHNSNWVDASPSLDSESSTYFSSEVKSSPRTDSFRTSTYSRENIVQSDNLQAVSDLGTSHAKKGVFTPRTKTYLRSDSQNLPIPSTMPTHSFSGTDSSSDWGYVLQTFIYCESYFEVHIEFFFFF